MVDFYFSTLLGGIFFFGAFQIAESAFVKLQMIATVTTLDRVKWVAGDEKKALTTLVESKLAPSTMVWRNHGQKVMSRTPLSDVLTPLGVKQIHELRLIHD